MSQYVVRAQPLASTEKPPLNWSVLDSEVRLKNRQLRSDKPDVTYYLGSPSALSTTSSETRYTSLPVSKLTLPIPSPSTTPIPSPTSSLPSAPPPPLNLDDIESHDAGDQSDDNLDSSPDNSVDDIMAEVAPSQFSGTATENAEFWMRNFLHYCSYKEYGDAKILSLFKLLLVGSAATWLDSLPNETVTTWPSLKEAFLQRYLTPEFMRFKSAREMFSVKQLPTQSVDEFVAHLQQLSKSVGADDKMVRFAVLNGLRTPIANYVTQKQPKDMTELLEAARIAELTCSVSEPESAVSVQLACVQDQLRQITTKLDSSTVSAVDDRNGQGQTRTPSPRRVRFSDERTRAAGGYRSPTRDFSPRGRFPRRDSRGRGFGRPPRNFFRPPRQGNDFRSQTQCYRCGGPQHQSFNACPAVNRECRFCGKYGHFQRVCRAAARAATQRM